MRTTIDFPDDAYRLIKALAEKRRTTMGNIVAEAVMNSYGPRPTSEPVIVRSRAGFPVLTTRQGVITDEDVRRVIEEDEEADEH